MKIHMRRCTHKLFKGFQLYVGLVVVVWLFHCQIVAFLLLVSYETSFGE